MRARRVAGAALLTASTAGLWLLVTPSTGHAQEPDITAWWSATNLGDPAPKPPAPPDVPEGDLLVQGSNAVPASPLAAAPTGAQAVAGLRFDVLPTDLVGDLRLVIDGSPPPQVSVVACRAAEAFSSASNGAWTKVPKYDGDACVDGKLDDDAVVFADMSKLVSDGQLGVVLLPGPVDRVVFKQPGADTLDVTHAGAVGTKAPDFGAGATGGSTGRAPAASQPQASVGGSAVAPPSSVGLPATSDTSTVGESPVVAGTPSSTAPGTTQPQTRPVADEGWSTGERRGIALLVIAAEVVAYALLSRLSPPPPVAVAGGTAAAATVGGRLRPPDRGVGGGGWRRTGSTSIAGVGRFRHERTGPPPRL